MNYYLMTCGHVSNAILRTNEGVLPCCVICDCYAVEKEVSADYGLEGRKAKCSGHRGEGGIVPSNWSLAFFKYRGPDSTDAVEVCAKCGYRKCAHEDHPGRRNVVAEGKCAGFVPHGPFEYDEYYCGHDGWD